MGGPEVAFVWLCPIFGPTKTSNTAREGALLWIKKRLQHTTDGQTDKERTENLGPSHNSPFGTFKNN